MELFSCCKAEIFIPESHLNVPQTTLQQVDAGHIGDCDSCLSYSYVTGCWRPLKGNNPYLDSCDEVNRKQELKVEMTCMREQAKEALATVKKVHPCEGPIINVIPLYMTGMDGISWQFQKR